MTIEASSGSAEAKRADRADSILPAGNFTELNTFQFLPFANFVSVIPQLPTTQLKALLENAVSRVTPVQPGYPTSGNGRFAQIAGFRFTYTIAAVPGSRVIDVVLDDGSVIVEDGVVVDPTRTIPAATIDFLCRGGDEYPLNGLFFRNLATSYQQALRNYVVSPQGLNGVISSADYPAGGEGRIVKFVPSGSFPADVNGDSIVNGLDLTILLANWGVAGSGDVDGSGKVDGFDLASVMAAWTGS